MGQSAAGIDEAPVWQHVGHCGDRDLACPQGRAWQSHWHGVSDAFFLALGSSQFLGFLAEACV